MHILLLSLLALCLVAAVAGWWRGRRLRKQLSRGEISELPGIQKARPDGCCGQHSVCEKEQILRAMKTDPEYFDDEELDRYAGRPSGDYTDEEVEEFEEIMTTMQRGEVSDWLRSLQTRGIEFPDRLKDEAFLLIS